MEVFLKNQQQLTQQKVILRASPLLLAIYFHFITIQSQFPLMFNAEGL